jgi:uncharacterized membrane protein
VKYRNNQKNIRALLGILFLIIIVSFFIFQTQSNENTFTLFEVQAISQGK